VKTLLVESLGHTRMLKWSTIGAAHWFVFIGFYGLFLSLVEAFGEVWNPAFHLPLIGECFLWNLFADIIGTGTILGILYLIYRRQKDHPRRQGRRAVSPGRTRAAATSSRPSSSRRHLHPADPRAEDLQRPHRSARPGRTRSPAPWRPCCPTAPTCSRSSRSSRSWSR
jgi:hypothetical protein